MASVNPDFKGTLEFSSDHQYVIIDTSTDLPKYKNISHIPMVFWIDYSRVDVNLINPPPLSLLINPSNMNVTFSKKIQTNFARGGFVVEEWGEEQDVIQCEGKIGGYYIAQSSVKNAPDSLSGLNRYERNKSLSFKNLFKLLLVYRNNGVIFQNTTKSAQRNKLIQKYGYSSVDKRVPLVLQNQKNRIDRVGDVYLGYDHTIYRGAFNTFSITEEANSPYTLSYKFEFTVQRTVLKDNRDYNFYFQSSFENADVSKNISNVKNVILNSIATEQKASVAGLDNLNQLETTVSTISLIKHTTKVDVPVPQDKLDSEVSSNQLAQKTKQTMLSNNVTMNTEEVAKVKIGYDKMIEGKSKKDITISETGKNEVRETLKEASIRNGKTERQSANLADNVSKNLANELNPTKNPSFDTTIIGD